VVARRIAVVALALLPSCGRHDEPLPSPVATASAAVTADPCTKAKKDLDDFIATLDDTCEKDEDCGGYFLRDDTCRGPTMLHVPGCPPAKKPLLFAHQADTRKSCDDAGVPPCAPADYKAVCRSGRCVNAPAK
jgi:hypothetical protein